MSLRPLAPPMDSDALPSLDAVAAGVRELAALTAERDAERARKKELEGWIEILLQENAALYRELADCREAMGLPRLAPKTILPPDAMPIPRPPVADTERALPETLDDEP